MIAHEDKPGLFKFVWYCTRSSVKFCHHSFLCVNNGYFVDGIVRWNLHPHSHTASFLMQLLCPQLQPKLSGCIRTIQALVVSPLERSSSPFWFRLTPAQSKR